MATSRAAIASETSVPFSPATVTLDPWNYSPRVFTAPEAIATLNQQRTANGIPGDLVEDPLLSTGCLDWATIYRPAEGQYPHEELPGQPGYTMAGDEAARSSDLAGAPGTTANGGAEFWGALFNPWFGASLHEQVLMDPAATTVWFGASQSAACMGTSGERPFATEAFYSFPGPGATGVPVGARPDELPFSPQQAVGLKDEDVGPAIILWAESSPNAKLQSATLSTAGGAKVPVSLVTPETPAPPSPPDWPASSTFGAFSDASFVVPRVKFKANTSYVLTATWQTAAGSHAQIIPFMTAAPTVEFAGPPDLENVALEHLIQTVSVGSYTPTLSGRTLTIQATGHAVGRVMTVKMFTCSTRGKCVYLGPSHVPLERTVRLATTPVRLVIPVTPRGKRSYLGLSMAPFKVEGRQVYPYSSETLIRRAR
jgi:hypothetical protein